jgi:hypothetical protein
MPVVSSLNREQFLAWLGGSFVPDSGRARLIGPGHKLTDPDDVLLAWRDKPDRPRADNAPIIGVPERKLREFFAFTSTYVSTYVPFSAFFSVVPAEFFDDVLHSRDTELKYSLPYEIAGVLVSEAYLQLGEAGRSLEDIPVQASLATVSSSVIAALATGYDIERIGDVVEYWSRARRLLVDEPLKLPPEASLQFWYLVGRAFATSSHSSRNTGSLGSIVTQFINSQRRGGFGVDMGLWPELTKGLSEIQIIGEVKDESREDQVRRLDAISKVLLSSDHVDVTLRELVAGFLIAKISGGSMEYLHLCDAFTAQLPRTPLWFGLFVGFWKDNNVLAVADCLGRRVVRQVLIPSNPFSVPLADIGLHELEARADTRRDRWKLRTDQQSVIVVELLPGVSGRFRFARDTRTESAERRQLASEAGRSEDKKRLQDIRNALAHAVHVLDEMELKGSGRQGLFGDLPYSARREKRDRSGKR